MSHLLGICPDCGAQGHPAIVHHPDCTFVRGPEAGDTVRFVPADGSGGHVDGEVSRVRPSGAVEVETGMGAYLVDPADVVVTRRAGA